MNGLIGVLPLKAPYQLSTSSSWASPRKSIKSTFNPYKANTLVI